MKAIGGYFELELRRGEEYHSHALRLNTGRNALEFVLRSRKYSKLYIPYYACDAILEPLKKLSIEWTFYAIDRKFEPVFDFAQVQAEEAFLYVNYFGVKDGFVTELSGHCRNLITDNSQAFYSLPIPGIDTFYSCRKFFGVPDGAYIYMKGADTSDLPFDVSVDRFMHLTKRLELGPEAGYHDFTANEQGLAWQPIMQMSNLTRSLLCSIDYELARERRVENFKILHEELENTNELDVSSRDVCVPMVYPYLSGNLNLKQKLIENKIFVATYWPDVLKRTGVGQWECVLANNLLPIPIDQRYGRIDMMRIIDLVKNGK